MNKHLRCRFATRLRRHATVALLSLVTLLIENDVGRTQSGQSSVARPDVSLDLFLRLWVAENVGYATDQSGRVVLLSRTTPIRARITSDNSNVSLIARRVIADLSAVFGVEHRFVEDAPNLIIGSGAQIVRDGKPNRELLLAAGTSEDMVHRLTDVSAWSTGCGFYSEQNSAGKIDVSLIFADLKLPQRRLDACVVSGILYAFGLRMKYESAVHGPADYIPYLLMAPAVQKCAERISSVAREDIQSYSDCIVSELKLKITP